jgi:hypothetical protein
MYSRTMDVVNQGGLVWLAPAVQAHPPRPARRDALGLDHRQSGKRRLVGLRRRPAPPAHHGVGQLARPVRVDTDSLVVRGCRVEARK